MAKMNVRVQKKVRKPERKSKPKQAIQSKTVMTPLVMPEPTSQLTPLDVLDMQRKVGNQATQKVLQTYPGEMVQLAKKKKSDKKGKVTFKTGTVVKVADPWKKAPLSPDPALLPEHRTEKTVIKAGKPVAKAATPLKYDLHTTRDVIVKYVSDGFLIYYLAKGGSTLKKVTAGLPDRWKRPFTRLGGSYKFNTKMSWIMLAKEPSKFYIQFEKNANKYLIQPARVLIKLLKYSLVKIGGAKYHVKKSDIVKEKPKHEAVAGTLFPGGTPLPSHVQQTGLGDCYLQAFLINTAVQNPEHLKKMMSDNGDGTVTVRYYYKSGAKWNPIFIKVKKSIATGVTGDKLYHAGALWSHMIEKSYAVFAGKHGQYGAALRPPTKKGYEGIEGGWTAMLNGVFYGSAAKEDKVVNTSFDTDSAKLLKANFAHIKKLLEFKSAAGHRYLDEKKAVTLTASADWQDTLTRIIVLAKEVEKTTHSEGIFGKAVRDVRKKAESADKAIKDPANSGKKKVTLAEVKKLIKKAKDYVVGGIIGKVAAKNPKKRLINRLNELLNNFKELGTDSSSGQRFIYTHHAYSVVDVSFKDKKGKAYWPSNIDLIIRKSTVLANIDPAKSKITLRNPHRTNVPTLGATSDEAGKFTISLEQYLTNFTRIEHAIVEKT